MCTRLRIELPAVPETVPNARRAITRMCEHAGIEDELTGQIRLAVTEACTNCVLHAYEGDGDDTFSLEATVEDDALVVVVRDAGAGMTQAVSPRAGFGYGLRLMRLAASSIDVTTRPGRGTRVAMRFALR